MKNQQYQPNDSTGKECYPIFENPQYDGLSSIANDFHLLMGAIDSLQSNCKGLCDNQVPGELLKNNCLTLKVLQNIYYFSLELLNRRHMIGNNWPDCTPED